MHLPDHSSIVALVNTLTSYFRNKVSVTLPSLNLTRVYWFLLILGRSYRTQLVSLPMRCAILFCWLRASNQTLDPIPTSSVKAYIDIVVTPITSVIRYHSESSFPSHFESALVSPLLKKPSLDKDSMKNYRPVSNLSFLSKVLEKVVVNQLNSHLNRSNTFNHYQSAYRKFQLKVPFFRFILIF